MDSKIQELTEKIFNEGVEKGNRRADEIIREAQAKADKLLADAHAESARIIAEATKKSNELHTTTESDLRHASQQVLSAVKQSIVDLIIAQTLLEPLGRTLADPALLRELIITISKNLGAQGEGAPRIEILLSADRRNELEHALENGALATLDSGMEITFSKAIRSGFQIRPKGGSYKISVTDEDFAEFFKGYVRPRLKALLFGE